MYKFEIERMGCMSCVAHIEEELRGLDKGIKLKPNLRDRILEIESGVSRGDVKQAIEAAGYEVKDLS